jgi:hypothetical protein
MATTTKNPSSVMSSNIFIRKCVLSLIAMLSKSFMLSFLYIPN